MSKKEFDMIKSEGLLFREFNRNKKITNKEKGYVGGPKPTSLHINTLNKI